MFAVNIQVSIRRCFTVIIGLIATVIVHAQGTSSYITINAGGGLHSLKYNLPYGNTKGGSGFVFDLGYSHFFSTNWGIGTGLGLHSALSNGTINVLYERPDVDQEGDNYLLRKSLTGWEEKQKTLFLDIPLGIQYQRWLGDKSGIQAFSGIKVSLPFKSSYKVVSGNATTTGYYGQWNVELKDMPQHGFSTQTIRSSDHLSLKPAYNLFAEIGWLYKQSPKFDLYAGSYVSYAFNTLFNSGNISRYMESETYNSMLTSTNKVNMLTFGIKIGLRVNFKRSPGCKEMHVIEPGNRVIEPAGLLPEAEPEGEQRSITHSPPLTYESPAPAVVVIEDTVIKIQVVASQINIKFPLNSNAPLNDEFESRFEELATMLKGNPGLKVRIIGHTCNLAGRDFNLKVGMERAEFAKSKLMKLGVPEWQIATESRAFDQPLVPNTNEENRAMNRRIEFIIEKNQGS